MTPLTLKITLEMLILNKGACDKIYRKVQRCPNCSYFIYCVTPSTKSLADTNYEKAVKLYVQMYGEEALFEVVL